MKKLLQSKPTCLFGVRAPEFAVGTQLARSEKPRNPTPSGREFQSTIRTSCASDGDPLDSPAQGVAANGDAMKGATLLASLAARTLWQRRHDRTLGVKRPRTLNLSHFTPMRHRFVHGAFASLTFLSSACGSEKSQSTASTLPAKPNAGAGWYEIARTPEIVALLDTAHRTNRGRNSQDLVPIRVWNTNNRGIRHYGDVRHDGGARGARLSEPSYERSRNTL